MKKQISRISSLLLLIFFNPLYGQDAVLELSLADCRELVVRQNLEIAVARLGHEAARAIYKGERRAFWEPVLVLGAEREKNERQNNSEQFISQGVEDFKERNQTYRLAVEQPLPTGGQLQLGYTLRDLENNLREQRELEGPSREYEGFLGLVFSQPLLRNGGVHLARSMIHMAREESEAVFQEWRRQMMQSIGSAEAAYWELQIAQRRVELREASVRVAEKVLEDNRARRDAGRAAEVEIQQAEAGLAIRKTQLLEANQGWVEASNRLNTFFSESIRGRNLLIRASEVPELRELDVDLAELLDGALYLHPDILLRRHRLSQDKLREDFARNQRLPELDFTASYGYNSLGETSSDAWSEAREGEFPRWSVGVQLRMPLGGGFRSRGEHEAARLRTRQSETGLEATEIALMNALGSSARRVENNHAQARNYQQVAGLNERLLETELARLEAGQSDSRKVLDTEEKLTEALEAEATSLTRFMVALLELELSAGTLLKVRNLDPMDESTMAAPQPVDAETAGEPGEEPAEEPAEVEAAAEEPAEAVEASEPASPAAPTDARPVRR